MGVIQAQQPQMNKKGCMGLNERKQMAARDTLRTSERGIFKCFSQTGMPTFLSKMGSAGSSITELMGDKKVFSGLLLRNFSASRPHNITELFVTIL